ncbi:isoflavone 2'-hydroxylase [Phtheirospermum japonicum]|uniref:Isoflavone 2'-hydroxylase n=1 Tax=Phtheirospermum japonicum TaxID=374723 RepID=A0A830CQ31_9LAMI|nr:isoflavone 2'-hydroxylase [Phtheirospermum japonicum]
MVVAGGRKSSATKPIAGNPRHRPPPPPKTNRSIEPSTFSLRYTDRFSLSSSASARVAVVSSRICARNASPPRTTSSSPTARACSSTST